MEPVGQTFLNFLHQRRQLSDVMLSCDARLRCTSTEEKRRHSERYSAKNLGLQAKSTFGPEILREYAQDDT